MQRAFHRPKDRKRTCTVQQNSRRQPLRQIGTAGNFRNGPRKGRIERKLRPDQPAKRKADDKKHAVSAGGHRLHDGIDPKCRGRQSHGVHHNGFIPFANPFFERAAHSASNQYSARICYGADHVRVLLRLYCLNTPCVFAGIIL